LKNSIAIILAIFVLVVSFLSFTNTPIVVKTFTGVKEGLGLVMGPALKVVGNPIGWIGNGFNGYINLLNAKKENDRLKTQLGVLLMENQKLPELERENKILKELLNVVEKKPNTLIAAKVTGEDLKNWFESIIIDKGRSSGVREKMPVITPKGLVGQAVEIDQWHAKVMVINDVNSSLDVNVEGKNTRGLLEGTGENILKLRYVVKNDEIEIGDKLATSGKDSIYPKGIPVGIVITVDRNKAGIFADIDVMPFNNFKQLDEVLIVKNQ
jgi:rod shape-determining protein MreC